MADKKFALYFKRIDQIVYEIIAFLLIHSCQPTEKDIFFGSFLFLYKS